MNNARWISLFVAMGAASCGGSEPAPSPDGGAAANQISFTTPEFEVGPGDAFECFSTDTTSSSTTWTRSTRWSTTPAWTRR
jgi:hypothetical protein